MSSVIRAKRNHHKQPKFFLKGFAAKDKEHPNSSSIWIYKKGHNFPIKKGTNNTAFTRDFYSFEEQDGSINHNKYEDILMKDFEQPAENVIRKLRCLEMVEQKERLDFSRYVASMISRGDWAKELQLKILIESADSMNEEYQNSFKKEKNKKKISKIIEEGKIALEKGEYFQQSIIRLSEKLSKIIVKMNWEFIVAPNKYPFLTSDKPVYYFNLDKKHGEVIFPISSKVAFSASWNDSLIPKAKLNKQGFWKINERTVIKIRDYIVRYSINEVYFSQKRNWLVKFVNKRLK